MMIYTGYFAYADEYQKLGLTPVSIARYPPSRFTGHCLMELAPSKTLLLNYKNELISVEEYREQYLHQLDKAVKWIKVLRYLEEIAPDGVVLCCYEKPNRFCHRHILSEYMRESGYDVSEILLSRKGKLVGGSVFGEFSS